MRACYNSRRKLEDCTFFKHKHGFDLRLTFYAFCQFLIYYDNGQYGICNASRFYFQKTPAELTNNQAFFLASLLPVVGLCNPLFQPEKFVKNRNRKLEDLPFSERIISENLAAGVTAALAEPACGEKTAKE